MVRGGESIHEAAMLDGAGAWRRFLHVTRPQVSPALLFVGVTGVVYSMQAFGHAYLLQNWQQQDSLLFYVLHIHRSAFEHHRMGYAEALAWTLFAVLILFTGAAVLSTRRRVHYDFEERGL